MRHTGKGKGDVGGTRVRALCAERRGASRCAYIPETSPAQLLVVSPHDQLPVTVAKDVALYRRRVPSL